MPKRNLRSWKPSLTVKSNARARHVSAFCHTENKWFNIPCIVGKSVLGKLSDMATEGSKAIQGKVDECGKIRKDGFSNSLRMWRFQWTLADVDGELFCYRSDEEKREGDSDVKRSKRIWIAVCNPMIPSSVCRLPPFYVGSDSVRLMKLVVDRENKMFKVVVMTYGIMAIFDSVASDWAVFDNLPGPPPRCTRVFVWRGALCFCSYDCEAYVSILDVPSGTWSKVDLSYADLEETDTQAEPGANVETPAFNEQRVWLVGNDYQVRLIQLDLASKDIICGRKMLHNTPNNGQFFSSATWVKESIELPNAIKALAVEFRECISHGGEYMCFNGGKTNHWIKYTFSTRTWQLMPFRGKRLALLKWFHWEPGFDIDLQ